MGRVVFGLCLLAPLCLAQNTRGTTRLRVGAFASARSDLFRAGLGALLTVRAAREGELTPAIFVSDAEGNLAAKNDEAAASSTFEWRAPAAGRYRVTIYSNSPSAVEYTIRVLPSRDREPAAQSPTYAVVPVFWATNRNLASRRPLRLDSEPSQGGALTLGVCEVSVPRDHRMGRLEGPSILRLEFRPDPERHVVMIAAEVWQPGRFFADLSRYALRSSEHEALLFIPGSSSTFEDTARRAAQISYDLGFQGPAVVFSWPSQGDSGQLSYNKDARNAEMSVEQVRALLTELSRNSQIQRVQVIAQGMGNRTLVRALAGMSTVPVHIGQIALLAPDIDAEDFRKLADNFRKTADHISLYASSKDAEIAASRQFAGYPRAGQSGADLLVMPGIDTIDASSIDISLVGKQHQAYEDKSQILSDLFGMLRGDAPKRRFGLRPARGPAGAYWIFAPAGN